VRATGITGPRETGSEVSPLTTQQREIAEFATSGLTNKQIGERIFLSHRPSPGTCRRFIPSLEFLCRLRRAMVSRRSRTTHLRKSMCVAVEP
jgi:hypothetical protein